ncbi:hypothetical protein K0M31_011423 [Melipona bicolor]|uniref:Uncharacterized protein n=1 Tax=Melipona bicolor TaxID=60889 RepID=A0AA40G9P7_9HYME|nr:hypothetical protein K0M31_011423 [Melipona bicolor]
MYTIIREKQHPSNDHHFPAHKYRFALLQRPPSTTRRIANKRIPRSKALPRPRNEKSSVVLVDPTSTCSAKLALEFTLERACYVGTVGRIGRRRRPSLLSPRLSPGLCKRVRRREREQQQHALASLKLSTYSCADKMDREGVGSRVPPCAGPQRERGERDREAASGRKGGGRPVGTRRGGLRWPNE